MSESKNANNVKESDRKAKNKLDSMGNERLSFGTRLLYASGGFTGILNTQMINMFLLFVYTDVFKIKPAFVAGLFLIVRVLDAIAAPVFGAIVDSTNTRWGKYRPYILIVFALEAVSGILCFTNPSLLFGSVTESQKYIYVVITYAIFSTMKSISYAPSQAILPTMTKSQDDYISVYTMQQPLVMLGILFVASGATPFVMHVGGSLNNPIGWSYLMLIFSGLTAIQCIMAFFTYKEKYIVVGEKKAKLTLKQMFTVIFKNRPALIYYGMTLSQNLSGQLRNATMLYFLTYYFHSPAMMAILGFGGLAAGLPGAFLSGPLSKKFGVKPLMVWGNALQIISGIFILFLPATSAGLAGFIAISFLGGFFSGLVAPVVGTLLPTAIDYAEWKFNVNANAFLGSMQGFMQTLATAVAGSLAAAALGYFGYVAGAPVQNAGTIMGLRLLNSVIPAVLSIFMMGVIWYDMTPEKLKQMHAELAERRAKANAKLEETSI